MEHDFSTYLSKILKNKITVSRSKINTKIVQQVITNLRKKISLVSNFSDHEWRLYARKKKGRKQIAEVSSEDIDWCGYFETWPIALPNTNKEYLIDENGVIYDKYNHQIYAKKEGNEIHILY